MREQRRELPGEHAHGASTVCRGSLGICDPAEVCGSNGANCPSDARHGSSTVCRSVAGICDVQEVCDGTNLGCPTDAFVSAPTIFPSNGADGAFNPGSNTVLAARTYHFTTINIPSGVTVTTNGTGVLELRATGTVTIAGTINVSGSRGGNGAAYGGCVQGATGGGGASGTPNTPGVDGLVGCPGAGAGGQGASGASSVGARYCVNPGGSFGGGAAGGICEGGGGGGGYAGGGGGGGYSSSGGAGASSGGVGGAGGAAASSGGGFGATGGAGTGVYAGAAGGRSAACDTYAAGGGGGGSIGATAAADLALASTFQPGSGGGGGGGPCTCAKPGGGGGGGGGGALRIATIGTLTVTGSLLANGGAGGNALQGASGGGGGSGGVVHLYAPSLTVSGTVQAVGGTGGNSNGCGINGGGGGLGRIKISAPTSACTLTGSFNPPLQSGCTPSGAVSGRVFVEAVAGNLGTVCRGSAGICDVAEVCSGTMAACPSNNFQSSGTVCRSVAGICDVQETCNGSMAACPSNSFRPSSTVCRASANQTYCDPIEYCTGGAAACPGDTVTRTPTTETCNSVDDNCNGQTDEPYQPLPVSCAALHRLSPTGTYQIDPDGVGGAAPFLVYCDMSTSGGGWTQTLKADGRATTFVYDSANWTTTTTVGTSTDNSFVEVKSSAFNTVPFDTMLVGFAGNGYDRNLQLSVSSTSLRQLFAGGQIGLGVARGTWLNLIPNSTLQPNCNLGGININPAPSTLQRVRIGILGNNEADCLTPDSRLGIGGYGNNCATLLDQSVGNTTRVAATTATLDSRPSATSVRSGATAINTWIGGALTTSCTVGVGACARTGTFVCRGDGTGTQCSVSPGSAAAETCNGIDDDCNGSSTTSRRPRVRWARVRRPRPAAR
ncbi:MAG: hypothetical protein IPN17_29610 [Deltaproteobacteria bacterium]|nr:hypothetical protein [Deltaproteobacteria bacterium]